MPKIEFPKQLKDLLEDSNLQAPIRDLANRVGEILADNKLTFFPDYTDHGEAHVNRVLKSEVELVPKEVWKNSKEDSDPRLLCDADAAVLIGATLLHDIAMHLHPKGFLELVGKDSRFQPLPWFCESHEGQAADVAWHELWAEYVREARRFSDRDLTNIIGEESARLWKFDALPDDFGQWELNHRLIVGEFIRRHHARLAHEIAIYGFPGLEVGSGAEQFPAMGAKGHPLYLLADLIGLTARSHGLNLRVCKAYLDATPRYSGTPRPMGTAALYPMALLRVADYLQIDRQRAPAVLLQLRNPQSPISVREWQKHRAVHHIGPANDPRGKMVTVSSDLSLPLYLQLRELLSGLQAEMDHSTAVLDEAYGAQSALGLDRLNLAIRRVDSNLQSPAFRDGLRYVPDKTGFAADPNLLTLLVEPLYGKEPGVGVRELMQNAVDAVCELDAWCKVHDVPIDSLDLPEQEGDVMIDFEKRDDSWFLRVQDRGIGMTSDTIQNYFLRAGASFRRSSEWSKEFLDDEGKPRVARAGRFGIGVFAVFLLGPSFKMWTRHVGTDKKMGYMVEATENSQLIEIQRVDNLPVGTRIEVELSSESTKALLLDNERDYIGSNIDWFCWDWPKVIKRVIRGATPHVLGEEYICPIRRSIKPPEYFVIYPYGFDEVIWTFSSLPPLSCNGLRIADSGYSALFDTKFDWPIEGHFKCPRIAILDSAANLPLTMRRDKLSQNTLPFIDNLVRDVFFSYIAHALICGPISQKEALLEEKVYPLKINPVYNYNLRRVSILLPKNALLRWCATQSGMVPADPWLFMLLNSESFLLCGLIDFNDSTINIVRTPAIKLLKLTSPYNQAILPLDIYVYSSGLDINKIAKKAKHFSESLLDQIASNGVAFLGAPIQSRVIVSKNQNFRYKGQSNLQTSMYSSKSIYKSKHLIDQGDYVKAENNWNSTSIPLEVIFSEMKDTEETNKVFFLAEIKVAGADFPQSMIAKIWNECLGPKPIPFDPVARKALIAEGCKHPDLKRHIEAWQEMKRTGSKWATGEWMNET